MKKSPYFVSKDSGAGIKQHEPKLDEALTVANMKITKEYYLPACAAV
jgi:hypothetical protein